MVVIVKGTGAIVRFRVAVVVCGVGAVESVTLNVSMVVPGTSGVPLSTPDDAPSVNELGSVPEDQL